MKKQTKSTKSKKIQQTKMATAMTHAVVVHNRRQRFWGAVALIGLFLCGLMVGLNVRGVSHSCATDNAPVVEPLSYDAPSSVPVCMEIERLLLQRLPDENDDVDDRIDRAKIFASLSERGCPENADAYVEHAKMELDIARAIENDEFGHEETIDVVETYKRINMQAAAEEIFEKAKRLTEPAIEFILQVEKIINE